MTCILDVQDLHFSYPDGHKALNGVSLQIAAGEKVALVGHNGAGKSTLMLHLNGILHGQGRVQVCGVPVVEQTLGQVRGMVGLVFQNPDDQLFSPTVFEDVAFGPLHMGLPAEEVRRRTRNALSAVGMESYIERVSFHLSIGEKKRIAIATVLSMNPQLLVLDEPTAGLDPRARRSLIRLLHQLDITMLVSTHDIPMVTSLFPRIIIMEAGQIVADGSTSTIMADPAIIAEYGLEYP